jgi:hypothetical protein
VIVNMSDPSGSGSGSAGDPSGDPTINYTGGYTLHNTPDVSAPSLYGGTNPCSVGVSGGVAVAGFGLSAGSSWSDRGCERRNGAVILFEAKMPDVAVALLCEDTDMRAAFRAAGKPCPQERAATPVASAAPAPVQVAEVKPAEPAPSTPRAAAAPAAPQQVMAVNATPVATAPAPRKNGFQGPKPGFCSENATTSTERAYYDYYCN